MSLSQRYSYSIRPLAADDPQRPSHIALIEGDEAVFALSAMFEAVHGCKTANAAVWDSANHRVTGDDLAVLSGWCGSYGVAFDRRDVERRRDFKALSVLFGEAVQGRKGGKALAPLENHIRGRLRAMAAAFPGKEAMVSLRANYQQTRIVTKPYGAPHVDNGFPGQIRFIETVYGPATCLIDDDQVAFRGAQGRIRVEKGLLSFWQVATGALTLMTTVNNSARPVVHTPPPKTDEGDLSVRIVVIYDLKDPQPTIGKRIEGMFR